MPTRDSERIIFVGSPECFKLGLALNAENDDMEKLGLAKTVEGHNQGLLRTQARTGRSQSEIPSRTSRLEGQVTPFRV